MLTAVTGAAGLLLLAAGAAKVVDPSRTAGALAAVGWPSAAGLVRAGAGAEALVGAAVLVVPGPVPATLAALGYTGFAVFVVAALRSGNPVGTCGCFGRADTPPHPVHVAVVVTLAAACGAAAAGGSDPLADAGAGHWLGATVLAAAAYTTLTRPSP
jgi:hypothetical protein